MVSRKRSSGGNLRRFIHHFCIQTLTWKRTSATMDLRKIVRVADTSRANMLRRKEIEIMATLTIDRGIYCIRWMEDRKRKSISLSGKKFSRKSVDELCRIIDKLVYYKQNPIEVPDKRTRDWLESANAVIQGKLAKAGLIIIPESHTVGELWEMFLKSKTDIKETTRDGYDYVEQRFFAFFDRKTDLTDLTPERFRDWKEFLRTDYRSPRTGRSE